MRLPVLALIALMASLAGPMSARADALGATQAREAIERGAQAWDVRVGQPAHLLPGSVRADLQTWERSGAIERDRSPGRISWRDKLLSDRATGMCGVTQRALSEQRRHGNDRDGGRCDEIPKSSQTVGVH